MTSVNVENDVIRGRNSKGVTRRHNSMINDTREPDITVMFLENFRGERFWRPSTLELRQSTRAGRFTCLPSSFISVGDICDDFACP